MKLVVSNEWLRKKIASGPDMDPEAGPALEGPLPSAMAWTVDTGRTSSIGERNAAALRWSLGTLVHQLRLRDGLTLAELSTRADVAEDELHQVERNPNYTARPRLLFHLSKFFGVSLNNLSQIAGATREVDRRLYNSAVQYAARSDDLSKLTAEARELLDEFVALLNERDRVSND